MSQINKETFDKGLTYESYRSFVNQLLSEGKTSGTNHSVPMLNYTLLNNKRMDRLDKTSKLSESLISSISQIGTKQNWLILVEAWCGDVAQNLPVIARMADQNDNIELSIIFRDENPKIMDEYLTLGARSIPKLVIFDENFNELTTWGPRPEPVQEMLLAHKNNPNETYQEYAEKAHTWYAKDRTSTLQKEFENLIDNISHDHQKVA